MGSQTDKVAPNPPYPVTVLEYIPMPCKGAPVTVSECIPMLCKGAHAGTHILLCAPREPDYIVVAMKINDSLQKYSCYNREWITHDDPYYVD